jgi:hypothetical protein
VRTVPTTAPSVHLSAASILVESGLLNPSQVEQARTRQHATGGRLGEAVVELGFAEEETIGRALASAVGVPFTQVDLSVVDPAVLARFPEGVLRRALAIPLLDSGGQIVVAMADPTDRTSVNELREVAGSPISVVVGAPAAIRRALAECRGGVGKNGESTTAAATPRGPRAAATRPSDTEAGRPDPAARGALESSARTAAESGMRRARSAAVGTPGSSVLHRHLDAALALQASEIHFVPVDQESVAVFYRLDSGLVPQDLETPPAAHTVREQLLALGVADLTRPEDSFAQGAGSLPAAGGRVQFHATHCRSTAGIATVLRVGPRLEAAPSILTLGIAPLAEAELHDLCEGPEGIVIVYGPPRSGGSTVLASLAALAAREDRRVLALEPGATAPHPAGTTRVRYGSREQAVRVWADLAVGQGADVVVLDDVLHGEAIEAVLGGAGTGRLVFARTDWLDGRELLAFLARSRHARAVLHDRPFVLLGLPGARREGAAVWAPALDGGLRPGTLTATILSLEERDELLARR